MEYHQLQVASLITLIICVQCITPPLSEKDLLNLDPRLRYRIMKLENRQFSNSTHSTKAGTTQFKSLYVSNSGYVYDNVQLFQETITVEATQLVSDATHYKAANIIAHIVRHMPPEVFTGIARNSHGVGIFTTTDHITVFPENAMLADTPLCHGTCTGQCSNTCSADGRKLYTLYGLTNSRSVVVDKNVACAPDDPYAHKENILVHEFAHLVMAYMPKVWRDKITTAYTFSKTYGIWYNNYAMINSGEYWATATSSFFLTVIRDGQASGMNKCNFLAICGTEQAARNWLKSRDSLVFEILSYIYTNNQPTIPSCLRVCM